MAVRESKSESEESCGLKLYLIIRRKYNQKMHAVNKRNRLISVLRGFDESCRRH